ncbi:unnamed protein product [Periconia digitata]|uniref:Uncharacterized protein n=1 Tax=Periconia digitata TaxID=1303443 RepID=A0A9W4U8W3_9PLEO|nr:unnamed protein product [Periconia digitata]
MTPAMSRLLILCFLTFASAQNSPPSPGPAGPDPVEHFCSRWWSQSTIKNDTLYIDSGVQKFDDESSYMGINDHIMTIPLANGWDWKKSEGDPQFLDISREPKNLTNPKSGTNIPSLFRGYMFSGPQNTSKVFPFGGTNYLLNETFVARTIPNSSRNALWSYSPGSGSSDTKWDQYDVDQIWMPNHGAGADAPDLGLGFYLNGQIDKGTDARTDSQFNDTSQSFYKPVHGMLVLDLVHTSSAAKNLSTSTMKKSLSRVGGSLDYIPSVGDSGILVALGGQIQPALDQDGKASSHGGQLIDFQTVDVFDIDSYIKNPDSNGTWFQQNTTGDIPSPRIDFCTVTVSAADNSSHHIYVYSGWDPTQNNPKYYDDIVVLSLPSFRWKIVWPENNSPRWGHNCHYFKSQIITVGGNNTNTNNNCDWEKKGVGVFHMIKENWSSSLVTTDPDFKVSPKLLSSTNGTADGKAKSGQPEAGWSSKTLHGIFWKSRWTVPTTWDSKPPVPDESPVLPTAPPPASSPDPPNLPNSPDPLEKSKSPSTAALAGGISAGVVSVGLLAAALIYWHHRRHSIPAELHNNHKKLAEKAERRKPAKQRKLTNLELQGNRENNPMELDARIFFEADNSTAARGAELSGTTLAPGATPGRPIVRFPGDDLPVVPENSGGLRRGGSRGLRSSRRGESRSQRSSGV